MPNDLADMYVALDTQKATSSSNNLFRYDKLIGSLKESLQRLAQWEKSKLLLGWLVCAKRSMQWHELQSILAFDLRKKDVNFDHRMLRQHVQRYLGSMVHILDGGHIRLIHPTARRLVCYSLSK